MKKLIGLFLVFILISCSTFQGMFSNISKGLSGNNEPSKGNPSFIRQRVDYAIRDSVDQLETCI